MPQSTSGVRLAALLLGNVALAFGPWFVRMADTGPVAAGFWRMALAAPLIIGLALMLDRRAFAGAMAVRWPLVLGGVAFAADLASWHLGIARTTLANSTLFGNSAVLIFPLWAFLVARSWPGRWEWTALALASLGGAILLGRSAQIAAENLVGDLLCLLAGALYAVYFIQMAQVRTRLGALPAVALSSLLSAVPLLILAALMGERIIPADWTGVVLLALMSQVIGQGLMIFALAHFTPLVIGIALLIQPVIAAVIGWAVYGEHLGPADLLGAVLVAVALVVVRRGEPARPLASGDELARPPVKE